MPEGPMNVERNPVTVDEVELQIAVEPETPVIVDVPVGQTAHFPTHAPRLTSGGAAVLKALTGR
jgi:hypothetical protein